MTTPLAQTVMDAVKSKVTEIISTPTPFTIDEVDAMRVTKNLLLSKFKLAEEHISSRLLAIITMTCKLDPQVAATKYELWHKLVCDCVGMKSFDDAWKEVGMKGENLAGTPYARWLMSNYVCGKDTTGRSVLWIRSWPVSPDEEIFSIKESIMFYCAFHADMHTLRNGIIFVLDPGPILCSGDKYKNESKLQKIWRAIPIRAQIFFILEINALKRFLINALLAIVNFFISKKMAQRMVFATLDDVRKEIGQEAMPTAHGGVGGGVATDDDIVLWVQKRLSGFPTLPDLSVTTTTTENAKNK